MKLLSACAFLALGSALSIAGAQELPADPGAQIPVAVATPDPEVAAASVSKALKEAKGVPARGITVATHASTIVLTGEVDTEAQRVAALAAAEKAAGGVRISSRLEVKPLEDRSPKEQLAAQQSAQLVRDVEAALKADARTAHFGIVVSSADANSIVLLGLVPTRENRTTVQSVASRVKGVGRIDNRVLTPEQ
jgi:osmotically-inducible protein OsmY